MFLCRHVLALISFDLDPPPADMNVEKLQKMAGTVRTGGKGTVRRSVTRHCIIYIITHHASYP